MNRFRSMTFWGTLYTYVYTHKNILYTKSYYKGGIKCTQRGSSDIFFMNSLLLGICENIGPQKTVLSSLHYHTVYMLQWTTRVYFCAIVEYMATTIIKVCSSKHYKFVRQQKRVIYVCAYNSSLLRPITMKFGTQGYCRQLYKFINNNKQPHATNTCNKVSAYSLLMQCRLTMKFGMLLQFMTCA